MNGTIIKKKSWLSVIHVPLMKCTDISRFQTKALYCCNLWRAVQVNVHFPPQKMVLQDPYTWRHTTVQVLQAYSVGCRSLRCTPHTSGLLLKCLLGIPVTKSGHFSHRGEYEDKDCINITSAGLSRYRAYNFCFVKEAHQFSH